MEETPQGENKVCPEVTGKQVQKAMGVADVTASLIETGIDEAETAAPS